MTVGKTALFVFLSSRETEQIVLSSGEKSKFLTKVNEKSCKLKFLASFYVWKLMVSVLVGRVLFFQKFAIDFCGSTDKEFKEFKQIYIFKSPKKNS